MSELLIELVRRYGPSQRERPAVEYLVNWMRAHHFDRAWIDMAGNACGERGSEEAPHLLMLLGHIDTVPGEIPVRVDDGILYGRGSVDAKGSLAAFAEATAQAAIPDGWRVMVVGGVEEEIASSKGATFIRDNYVPSLCIIGEPSHAHQVTLGYKGHLLIDYTLTRQTFHTSRPEAGVAAVAADLWRSVRDWCAEQAPGAERDFDRVYPHLSAINTESDGLQNTVRMTIELRLPPAVTPDDVISGVARFQTLGELSFRSKLPGYLGDKNNALVRGMLAAIRAQDMRPGFLVKGGTSDMNVVCQRWDCPIIAYGTGDSHLDHTPNEHLALREYEQAVATVRHLIEHLAAE